jgi:replicative DNA helicase
MPDQQRRNSKKVQAVNMDSLGLEMGNKPPQALDVEEAVLGAMLIEPTAVDEALDELSPNCFYSPQHKMVFEAMTELVNEHTAVDLLTVADKLKAKGNLEVVGGPVALANLSQKVGAAAHIEYYIKILKQKAIQRDLISASYDILKQSFDDSIKVDDLVDQRSVEDLRRNPKRYQKRRPRHRFHHHGGHGRHPRHAREDRPKRCSIRFRIIG